MNRYTPSFSLVIGRVSLIDHGLGSAIPFDILRRQPPANPPLHSPTLCEPNLDRRVPLGFDVHVFSLWGAAVRLFQTLKGRNIAPMSIMEWRWVPNTPLGEEVRKFMDNEDVPLSCPNLPLPDNVFWTGW